MTSTLLKGIYFLNLTLLAAAVLLGEEAVEPVVVAIGGLLLGWMAVQLFGAGGGAVCWVKTSVNPILIAFLGVCTLQLAPLPAPLLAKLSPVAFSDKSEAISILSGKDALIRSAAAYAPRQAYLELTALAAAAGAFFLFLNTLSTRKRITGAAAVLVSLGLLEALAVLGRYMASGSGGVEGEASTGLLLCSLPAAIGLALSVERRSERLESGLDDKGISVRQVAGRLGPESFRPIGLLGTFSILMIASALYLSSPPAARFVSALSLTAASLSFFAGKRNKKSGLAFLVVGLAYLATLGSGPAEPPGDSASSRAVSAAARDYPLLGLGLGSFEDLYLRYTLAPRRQPGSLEDPAAEAAGSSFGAEFGAEVGVIGFALLLFCGGYLVFHIGKIRHRRKDRHAAAVGTGAGAGVLALLLLGLTGPATLNFSLLLCCALLAAAAKAAVFRRGRGFSENFFYPKARVSLPKWARPMVLLAAAAGVAAVVAPMVQELPQKTGKEVLDAKEKAAERFFPFTAANFPLSREAEAFLSASLLRNPAQPLAWLALGRTYAGRREDPFAYIQTWLPRADRCFAQAVSYAPHHPAVLFPAAGHFVERAALVPESGGSGGENALGRNDAVLRFQETYRRALAAAPDRWKAAVEHVWRFFPDERIVMAIVPEKNLELRDRVLRYIMVKETE